jgi:hypothetical protein
MELQPHKSRNKYGSTWYPNVGSGVQTDISISVHPAICLQQSPACVSIPVFLGRRRNDPLLSIASFECGSGAA